MCVKWNPACTEESGGYACIISEQEDDELKKALEVSIGFVQHK